MTPLSGLITKGLGLPACSSMIVAFWTLGPCGVVVETPGSMTGGSIPLAPGEIQHLYQPVDHPWNVIQPEQIPQDYVKITVTMNDHKNVKEIFVPKKGFTYKATIKSISFLNAIKSYVSNVNTRLREITSKTIKKSERDD